MNNVFAFSNAEEFKELFGMRTMANGEQVRKNKILLGFLKDYNFHKFVRNTNPSLARELFRLKDVSDLYSYMAEIVAANSTGRFSLSLLGCYYESDDYRLDHRHGVCEDHDFSKVRVINNNGSVVKVRAGKLFKSFIMSSEFGRNLPESTVLYICEEFTRRWEVWAYQHIPVEDTIQEGNFELHVDDDFRGIYDSDRCVSRFSYSCMFDRGQHVFYEDAVDAKAAYLTNDDDEIVARCIIFTNVHEVGSNRIWRMAERQYALRTDKDGDAGNEHVKRIFIDKLIKAGYIDCYKRIGAACCESTAILDVDGHSLSDKEFYIPCTLENGDTISYQDTFKYYSPEEERAYNKSFDGCICLDITSETVEIPWDDYHERYCNDVTEVRVDGRWIYCDSDDLDDFVAINGNYYHEDDVLTCPHCQNSFLDDDCYYSELLEEDFCCEGCRHEAELKYASEHGLIWDEFNDEWIEASEASAMVYRIKSHVWLPDEAELLATTLDYAHGRFGENGERIGNIFINVIPSDLPVAEWPSNEPFSDAVKALWDGDEDFEVVHNCEVITVHDHQPSCESIFGVCLW